MLDTANANVELTDDHYKLLYLISLYSKNATAQNEKETWIKELPIRTMVFEGIIERVFLGYDYAPISVELPRGRRFLNISQEAEDDLADLREMGLIQCLKLSSATSRLTSAYKITTKGSKVEISEDFKSEVKDLITCSRCGDLTEVVFDSDEEDENFYLVCRNKDCALKTVSGITQIEDVSYSTEPYFPTRPVHIEYEKHGDSLKFLQVDFKNILERRVDYFKDKYSSKYQQKQIKAPQSLKRTTSEDNSTN
jgi:hypothetical protein